MPQGAMKMPERGRDRIGPSHSLPGRGMTLQVMVVGCGTVFDQYYQGALKKLESRGMARVVAFVDPNLGRTAAIEKHFPSARAFATPAEAFAMTIPNLTIIASPPKWHAEHALAAFSAGSHVLCEKPMAASIDDAERVYGWPVSTDFPFRRATAGGGVLIDKGTHVLDFLAAMFGRPTAAAYADDAQTDGVETNCQIRVAFPGASGKVQLSWSQPLVNGLHITGSAGQLTLHPWRLDAVRLRRNGGAWETRVSAATWPCDLQPGGRRGTPWSYEECVYYQIVQSLRAVVHGEPVPVTGEDGLAIVHAIDACYRQATPLRLAWLTEAEQAQADSRHWSRPFGASPGLRTSACRTVSATPPAPSRSSARWPGAKPW